MQWINGLLVPDRLRLRATTGPAGARAARLLYQQRRHSLVASAARWGRWLALSQGIGRRCEPPLEEFEELCDLLGITPVGAAAIHSRGYPARVADRLVLCIVGHHASVVVKVGPDLDPGLSAEAALLATLKGLAGPVIVPRVQWHGAWLGYSVLAMKALQVADGRRDVSVDEAADTATALSLGSATVGPLVHGDLAPWNMLRTPDGLALIDWEGARMGRDPLFDLAHFVVMRGSLLRSHPPEDAVALLTVIGSPGWRHLAALDVDPATAPALLEDYLERTWEHTELAWPYREALLHILSTGSAGRTRHSISPTARPESTEPAPR